MNTFWKDPRRRELIVAAGAGCLWALLGLALAAHGGETASPPVFSAGPLSLVETGAASTGDPTSPERSWYRSRSVGERSEAGAGVAFVPCVACTSFLTSPPAPLRQGEGSGGNSHEAASCRIRNQLAGGMTNVGSG